MARSAPQSQPRLRRVPRIRYPNDDSDSEVYTEHSPSKDRPRRRVRNCISYRENSEDETSQDEAVSIREPSSDAQTQASLASSHPSQRQNSDVSRKRGIGRTTRILRSSAPNKRRKLQSSCLVKEAKAMKIAKTAEVYVPNARIPPWQTLPYFTLLSIMSYAAWPLYGPASRPQSSISWLCTTGGLCRAFHDACVAALLYSPPIYPLERAQGLIRLLEKERDHPATLSTSYGAKIRYLDIEVRSLLTRKATISLEGLVALTPQLRGIRLYTYYDDMMNALWATPEAKKIRWQYPGDLVRRLEDDNLVLRSFEWNGRFPTAVDVLKEAMAAHVRPSFNQVHELTILNITLPEKAYEADLHSARRCFAVIMKNLPVLRSLTFRSCVILDDVTMPMLPANLFNLEITNCPQVTSDLIEGFLTSSGRHLRALKLNNNQSMSLGFMSKLKFLCPDLQSLEIDMLYIDASSFQDRDPLFEELLPQGSPTWPSTLVSLSIENMRQISEDKANKFFESLVDASHQMPFLRKIILKVILKDAGWRERAKLRQKWIPAMEDVFLSTDMRRKFAPLHDRCNIPVEDQTTRNPDFGENDDTNGVSFVVPAQRRCDVVDVVISDQRPAETQYRENDFLDSEPSDDDEYEE